MKPRLLDLTKDALEEWLLKSGEKKFRAKQVWEWLHVKRASTFDEMSNVSKELRAKLADSFDLRTLGVEDTRVSADGLTEKWLYSALLDGGEKSFFETVLIREKREKRRTVCVSSQIGCAMACCFCASGYGGFDRNLETGEILEQVYRADDACREAGETRGLTNIVFMGMGEPLLNYDAVLAAAKLLASEDGFNLGGRHLTISTVGVPSGILRLAGEGVNFRLALSLHAPDQETREKIIPAAKNWKLSEVMSAVREFAYSASRDVTMEYCLIHNVNDGKEHARKLVGLLEGLPCKVNLIPLNPVDHYDGCPPPPDRVRAFQEVLEKAGLDAPLRAEKGQDIDAACGQLRARKRAGL
jgi:23S rRNA (adenine2503-C2)-methyltransferase